MTHAISRRTMSGIVVLALMAAGLLFWGQPQSDAAPNSISLQEPLFFKSAEAATPKSITSVIADEAGISGYFQSSVPIDLDTIRGVYRTIETENEDYILGTVRINSYLEHYDTHVYIHRSGWMMAYYLKGDPVSKIVDIREYSTNTAEFSTLFENVLSKITGQAGIPFPGVTHYDFRYPNATHMMIIGEVNGSFNIMLPSTYGFFERSWAIYDGNGGNYRPLVVAIDGETIYTSPESGGWSGTSYGAVSAEKLAPDANHNVKIASGNGYGSEYFGALILVYRVP